MHRTSFLEETFFYWNNSEIFVRKLFSYKKKLALLVQKMSWSPEVTTMQEGSTCHFRSKAAKQSLFRCRHKGTLHVSHIHIVLEGWEFVLYVPHLRFVHLFGWRLL